MNIPDNILCGTMEDYINYIKEESYIQESSISSVKEYALPEKKLYPIDSYDHVVNTIKLFNVIDSKYHSIIAENVVNAMNKYNVPLSVIGKNNKIRNYISISEASGPGNPVVGINNNPVIVNNMMNNVFAGDSINNDVNIISKCIHSTVKSLAKKKNKYFVPYIPYITESYNINPNIGFYKDMDGIFVMNEYTGLRSPSYENVDDIDDRTIEYITYNHLNDDVINY